MPNLTWNDVVSRHGSPGAVSIDAGEVRSVLCGGPGHLDAVMEDVVHYSIPRRPFYKRTMIALEASAKKGNKFTVFQKLKQNQWADLGQFKVAAIHERKDDVIFELVRLDAM